ncbi:MAG: hypothetical protein ABH858_00325, partial [Candidatus Omnitrophota bacterium]
AGTRERQDIRLGASPRASIALMNSVRAWALLSGRDYVIPDDVYKLSFWVLNHRINVAPKAVMAGETSHSIISDLLNTTLIV